jgi:hypothetical protein
MEEQRIQKLLLIGNKVVLNGHVFLQTYLSTFLLHIEEIKRAFSAGWVATCEVEIGRIVVCDQSG